MEKKWKDIPGYEGLYKISNNGDVVNVNYRGTGKHHEMIPSMDTSGYLFIGLTKNKKRKKYKVHQIVAMAFLGHKIEGHKRVVDHINGIKTDNDVSNLRIVSNRINIVLHKIGSNKYTGVKESGNMWTSQICFKDRSVHLGTFETKEDAYRCYCENLLRIENNKEPISQKRIKSSKYKGVSFIDKMKKYIAYYYENGKQIKLGYFKNEIDARNALINRC